jgi:hypothetical protein
MPAADRAPWGCYTLANDLVLDWALALLASLRRFAPDLPVAVIPFDDRQVALASHLDRLGHRYLESAEIDRFHELGRRFYPADEFSARGFRKLAAFSGPFERFVFLDTDVLALGPLDDLLAAITTETVDLVYFDTDVEQVFGPGPLRRTLEARSELAGFNAGLFASRHGLLDADRLASRLSDLGSDWTDELVPNAEQPFLNLYSIRAGWRVARASDLVPDSCSTCWAAAGRLEFDGSSYRLRDSGRWDEGRRMRFAHWAGFRLAPEMPNRPTWSEFRAAAA